MLADAMFTPDQMNAFFGNKALPKFSSLLDFPIVRNQSAKTSRGARARDKQWEKDSSRLELLLDCQYPGLEVYSI